MLRENEKTSFGQYFLADIVEWICNNLEVEEVFDKDTIKDYVVKNFEPEDVFPVSELETWAEENGYNLVDDNE